MKTYKGLITTLLPHQVFVFGSNTQGRHGKGAALTAKKKFGAIYGQSRGFQGQSYAIITKDLTKPKWEQPSRSKTQIAEEIQELHNYVKLHPYIEFIVSYTANSINLNGYSPMEIAELFSAHDWSDNIVFEEGFYELMKKFK